MWLCACGQTGRLKRLLMHSLRHFLYLHVLSSVSYSPLPPFFIPTFNRELMSSKGVLPSTLPAEGDWARLLQAVQDLFDFGEEGRRGTRGSRRKIYKWVGNRVKGKGK